uniref:Myozenin 3a n=1 Tax=Monopterus albus TaxID=43700 RepID=A0A3Q3JXL6_MONAL|nr:myozenin-2-like [Monopterus albus]
MIMMQSAQDAVTKQRMLQAKPLSAESRGGFLNLGKKISVPKDLMMEELNLPSNRGSRMFQARQKRLERFILENNANSAYDTSNAHLESTAHQQIIREPQGGKENQVFSIPGKHSLAMNLQKTVAKKGSPDVLAPGYSGPLKEMPPEKFNTTVIPKSYSSPWREALGNEELLNILHMQLPQLPYRLEPANYRCFNRSPMPFGGTMTSKRVIPVIGYEAVESQDLPSVALERMCQRPNFNRAPKGWGIDYCPESNDL